MQSNLNLMPGQIDLHFLDHTVPEKTRTDTRVILSAFFTLAVRNSRYNRNSTTLSATSLTNETNTKNFEMHHLETLNETETNNTASKNCPNKK